MQQRRVRLGDIVDDYCPRERRVTNHAVVAMIDDTVKQTRCTTCDADHEYRAAKAPAPRRRKPGALSGGELQPGVRPRTAVADPDDSIEPDDVVDSELTDVDESIDAADAADAPADSAVAVTGDDAEPDDETRTDESDEWPVHRPLIRATLPRPEGAPPPERKAPDFSFRPGGGGRFDPRNGQRPRHRPMRNAQGQPSGQGRFGGGGGQGQRSRQGAGQGQGQGGQGQGQGQRQGNRPGPAGRPGQGRGPRPGGSGRKRGR